MPAEQPAAQLAINGAILPGLVVLELDAAGYFAAARFRAGLALASGTPYGAAYFATLGMAGATIAVSAGGSGFTNLLTGQIDNIRLDLPECLVWLSGRDLTARLIDTEISESFVNQTASQIAGAIAERHGFGANITPTTTPVGQYYELDHARSALELHSRAATEWNLLAALAQIENFALSVTGTTLNFGPAIAGPAVAVTPDDFLALSFDIATALPGCAVIKSWNTRNKEVVTGSQGSGAATTLIRPNLTASLAATYAENHLNTLNNHIFLLIGTMPGEVTLSPGMQLSMGGTDSPLDQIYTIASISRRLDAKAGFKQTIRAYAA